MKRLQVWPKDVLACPWRAERGTERVGPSTAVVIIGDAYLRGGSPVLDVRRRHFMTLLGGAAAWPLAARAQQAAMPFVGLLSGGQLDDRLIDAVRQGLKDGGYITMLPALLGYRICQGLRGRASNAGRAERLSRGNPD